MSGVKLGGRESDLTIPECGLAIMQWTSSVQISLTSLVTAPLCDQGQGTGAGPPGRGRHVEDGPSPRAASQSTPMRIKPHQTALIRRPGVRSHPRKRIGRP